MMSNTVDTSTPFIDVAHNTYNTLTLDSIKQALSIKIKDLPDTSDTAKLLFEIEDILAHVNSGGKLGLINDKLQELDDPTVLAAQKEIARFVASIDMTPHQRNDLFSTWKSDNLVDVDKLLSKGKHSFSELVSGYESNSAVKQLVDELMEVSALGQGKGEFGLNVLSKRIAKPVCKGDLLIDGRKIEVKTVHHAAARFTDTEVRPAAGYEFAALAVTAFVKARSSDPAFVPKSGLNLTKATQFSQELNSNEQQEYFTLIEQLITVIFGGEIADNNDIAAIMRGIKAGDVNVAVQAYACASFNYYMSIKDDEGVLYINLGATPKFTIFYKTVAELTEIGHRFDADTAYITSPTYREIYPKIRIVPTSRS